MAENEVYFNLRRVDNSYHYTFDLPGKFGTGHAGKDLDSCKRLILNEARDLQARSVVVQSARRGDFDFSKPVPLSDLQLLVLCLQDECSDITFRLQ